METYQEVIERLKSERIESRNKIHAASTQVQLILNTFKMDEGETLVSWKDLHSLKMGYIYEVNEGVTFVKIEQSSDKIVFEADMNPEQNLSDEDFVSFGIQDHDIAEFLEVLEGHLIEPYRGDKVYIKGQTLIYEAKEKHKPQSKMKSKYLVIFKKGVLK